MSDTPSSLRYHFSRVQNENSEEVLRRKQQREEILRRLQAERPAPISGTVQATKDAVRNAPDLARGMAAGLLGVPGDLAQLGASAVTGLHNFRAGMGSPTRLRSPDVPFTSDKIAAMMGADPESGATQVGMIGAPDPGDLKRILAMTLFHGTPHKFAKFSNEAIGTGEGAQAYGHGLYFAESGDVAKIYQKELSGGDYLTIKDKNGRVLAGGPSMTDDEVAAATLLDGGYMPSASDEAKRLAAEWREAGAVDSYEKYQGHLYEVDIPDETIEKMLDWDAPLSEQPESFKDMAAEIKALESGMARDHPNFKDMVSTIRRQFDTSAITGGEIYNSLANSFMGTSAGGKGSMMDLQSAASSYLQDRGIPGIRFLDGNSRSAGEGTRNIVVFDPEDIRQVKRDGELVYGK